MYMLFLDESGTPPKPDKAAGKYMVIGGLIIPEGAWQPISKELTQVKAKYGVKGEIKFKFFSVTNSDPNNSLTHLDQAKRDSLRTEIFSIITSRKSTKIIACVTCVEAAYAMASIKDQDGVYHLTYKGVTERFQYFLQDASRLTGQQQLGIVVSDHRMQDDDKRLRERHHALIDGASSFFSKYENYVETIFFSPSHISVGLQLADMVAGAVQRSFQAGDHRFIEMIKGSFRSHPNGKIDGFGLVRMPKASFIVPSGGVTF